MLPPLQEHDRRLISEFLAEVKNLIELNPHFEEFEKNSNFKKLTNSSKFVELWSEVLQGLDSLNLNPRMSLFLSRTFDRMASAYIRNLKEAI